MDQKPFIPPVQPQEEPTVPQIPTPTTPEPVAPISTPVEPGPTPFAQTSTPSFPPTKKDNHSLRIIIAAIAALVAIGAIVAIFLLNQPKKDIVKTAIENFFDNTSYLHMDGNFSINTNEASIGATISSDQNLSSNLGKAAIDLSMSYNNTNLEISLDAITDENSKNYIKVSGLTQSLENAGIISQLNATESIPLALITTIEKNWFAFDKSDLSNLIPGTIGTAGSSQAVECFANNSPIKIQDFKTSFMENYFVNATESKKSSKYDITIDDQKFKTFANNIITTGPLGKVYSCLGVDIENIKNNESTAQSPKPKIDLEVKNDRIASFNMNLSSGQATLTINLNFSYPDNITVEIPAEFINASDLTNPEFYDSLPTPEGTIEIEQPEEIELNEEELIVEE